ncbi:MAG: hypothetical protein RJB66_783 [Pseudomonadota bacterium]|jgi:organic hydroperoxide reductase OsmC/OhrA
MKQYPLRFQVTAETASGIQTPWTASTSVENISIKLAIPPEFDGPGGGLSPEDLYAFALQNCFIATFKVFAEKSRLTFNELNVKASLEVDRNEKGAPWMARIHFDVNMTGVQQPENAKRLLEKTSQSCMILNSVNTAKSFNFEIEA